MPVFFINHLTKYSYSSPVLDGANQIMLYPIEDDYQKITSHKITVSNNPKIDTYPDFYNNTVGSFMINTPHTELSITSEFEVETFKRLIPDVHIPIKEQWDSLHALKHQTSYMDFMRHPHFSGTSTIKKLIDETNIYNKSPFNIALEFAEYIYKNFKYLQGVTQVDSELDHVWEIKSGVCQDFTNILLQMLRMCGIPARYVSGYICPSEQDIRGEGATHAWVEAYIPSYGWFGIDPTNNCIANEFHVRLATGRYYKDCAPVKGVFKGEVDSELFVRVKVSSSKNENDNTDLKSIEGNKITNSFRRNQELIKQMQQQQQ